MEKEVGKDQVFVLDVLTLNTVIGHLSGDSE